MFFSKASIAAAVAFSSILGAVAQPLHNHHVHKREAQPGDAVVVLKHVVDSNGNLISIETVPGTPAATAVSPAVVGQTSTIAPQAAATTSAAASSAATSAATPDSAASSSSSSSSFNGGAKGIVYSPYKVGGCKTASEVKSDLAKLAGYEIIRLYGVDCSQIENVKAALNPGQKLFLGIFDVANLQNGLQSLISAIGNDWHLVHTISIGNELVNNGQATVAQISSYVSTAKPILSAAGYTGPVVSVDTFIAVINNPGLCQISDYIAVNAHPYFDGNIASDGAGQWVVEQIQRVWTACGGTKNVFISESGWPHQGQSNGKANASPADQSAAISGIKSHTGNDCILFTAFDDFWKDPGMYGIEQYFGISANL